MSYTAIPANSSLDTRLSESFSGGLGTSINVSTSKSKPSKLQNLRVVTEVVYQLRLLATWCYVSLERRKKYYHRGYERYRGDYRLAA